MMLRGSAENRAIFLLFGLLALGVGAAPAHAITTLRKVQVTDGDQIELLFDGKVNPKQIRTEFFNDIIQLSLQDVSVYPAKISSVSGMDFTKVFAYQYAPKLVRLRLTVKGKAESYQGRFSMKASGKGLSIRLDGGADQIVTSSSQAARVAHGSERDESPAARASNTVSAPPQIQDKEEQALLERVLKSAPAAAAAPAPVKEVQAPRQEAEQKNSNPASPSKGL